MTALLFVGALLIGFANGVLAEGAFDITGRLIEPRRRFTAWRRRVVASIRSRLQAWRRR